MMRELPGPDDGAGFSGGYIGTGPRQAPLAILRDATCWTEVPEEMRKAFLYDVVSQLLPGFRMRRGMILRWATGWAITAGIPNLIPPLGLHSPIQVGPWRSHQR
jgi:hypothetical protein